jgi:predicted alpha/beta hydrolase
MTEATSSVKVKVVTVPPATTQIPTAAGRALAAEIFAPRADPRGAALIVPAMGVTQGYYASFAGWLAEQGFLVATFDYRGIGRSRNGRMRDERATIVDWATTDCAAMVEAVAARAPGRPLTWIGHSLGGQILAFLPAPARARIAKAVIIASGSGYWLDNPLALRWRVWWLWYLLVPVFVRLFGYFPGKRLGLVGDVPRAAMEQWRRWCLDPDYAAGAEGAAGRAQYAAVETPLSSLSFTDDEFMSERNIAALLGLYTGAPRTSLRLRPADVGERRIGHFGFFRPRYERSLWRPHLLPALG